ncbi:hypothetical protein SAMN05444274_11452 [Mariniphaga anaerophila]|uniref:Uncharacterized protein n=1 Tax=Mariniphaga anaerophila TaxID=1484053 RepID=A0A1M5FSQ8_9BACT|nr:hypothetical protein SAMN05444274_11452 [Mariniphaga anaerophila]
MTKKSTEALKKEQKSEKSQQQIKKTYRRTRKGSRIDLTLIYPRDDKVLY